jgi:gamma-glutamyltranspeptidase/glutathione hydrolase
MSPTIVTKDGKPILALGTPSGTRILTCVAQTVLNYLEFEKPLYEAVGAIRFHQQWSPDQIRFGEAPLDSGLVTALEKMGHTVVQKNLGCRIQAIAFENGKIHGVSDQRGEGLTLGD